MTAKIAALVFFLFLALIILAADTGQMPAFVRAAYDYPNGDRVGHVVLYGIFAFLLSSAFPSTFRLRSFRVSIALLALLVFCVAEEFSQSLFSTRTPDPVDLICSCVGAMSGSWLAVCWNKVRRIE